MALNLKSPTTFTGLFVGETVQVSGGSSDGIPTPTKVGGLPVSALVEFQSTHGALLIPRMTTAEKNALNNSVSAVSNGMMVYDTDLEAFSFYENGAWVVLGTGSGDVIGPGASTDNAIVRWNGVGGTSVQNSVVIVDDLGNVSGVNTLVSAGGTASAPAYSFTADTNTGMYSTGLESIDFATAGLRMVNIGTVASAVNYLELIGSATGNGIVIGAQGTDANVGIRLVPKGTGAVQNNVGAVATPSYSFVGRTDTGMWSSAAATIDFSTTGGRQFQIDNIAAAVNWLSARGAAAAAHPTFVAEGADTDISVAVQGKGSTGSFIVYGTNSGLGGSGGITLYEHNNGNYVKLRATDGISVDSSYNLPTALPSVVGTFLTSDVGGQMSWATGVQVASGTLNAAQFAGMSATPVTLLAAPGAGLMYVVERFSLELIWGTTQYANGGAVGLQYGTTAALAGEKVTTTIAAATINGATANNIFIRGSFDLEALSTVANNAAISISNDTAAFTTGDSTFAWKIWYSLVSIT